MAKAALSDSPTHTKTRDMGNAKLKRAVMPMVLAVETLIVKGKKQGFLRPADILACFPHVELDPDQLFRIFNVFGDMGVEVTEREMDAEVQEPMDQRVMGTSRPPEAEQPEATAKAIKNDDQDAWQRMVATEGSEDVEVG